MERQVVGKTVPSYRIVLEHEVRRWKPFRDVLGPSQKEAFDALMDLARGQATAGSCACNPILFEPFVISILLGQYKKILELHENINVLIAKQVGLRVEKRDY